jgi:hypothetical protein
MAAGLDPIRTAVGHIRQGGQAMDRSRWRVPLAPLAALAVVATTACTSDDDATPGVFSEHAVESVTDDTIGPVVAALTALAAIPGPGASAALGGEPCDPIADVCDEGTLAICDTGGSTFRLEADGCLADTGPTSETVDGQIVGSFAGNGGTGDIDLQIADVSIAGDVDFEFAEGCIEQTLRRLLVETGETRSGATGTLTFCAGVAWPAGSLFVDADTDDHGDLRLEVELDGTPAADVTVFDQGSDELLGTCTLDLATQQATCTGS